MKRHGILEIISSSDFKVNKKTGRVKEVTSLEPTERDGM